MKSIASAALIAVAQAYYGGKLSFLRKMHEEMSAPQHQKQHIDLVTDSTAPVVAVVDTAEDATIPKNDDRIYEIATVQPIIAPHGPKEVAPQWDGEIGEDGSVCDEDGQNCFYPHIAPPLYEPVIIEEP